MTEDGFETTVKMTRRGTSTNKETIKTTVSAHSIEELHDRVSDLRERMEQWSLEFREIQPSQHRGLADDQSQLGETEA